MTVTPHLADDLRARQERIDADTVRTQERVAEANRAYAANVAEHQRTGGQAFPSERGQGMTLRDYFAGQAITTFIKGENVTVSWAAEWAYGVADAMLVARKATQTTQGAPPCP